MQFEECFVSLKLYKHLRNNNSNNITVNTGNNNNNNNNNNTDDSSIKPTFAKKLIKSSSPPPPPAPSTNKNTLPPLPPLEKQSPIVTSLLKAWLSTARCRLARVKEETTGKETRRKEIDIVKI
tara:strand:+ start:102 stop:470 length:369 start_codon:yes stop_codon:yes gene_type:complete